MNCTNCGREIDNNTVFCVYCGAKQIPSSAASQPSIQTYSNPNTVPPQPNYQNTGAEVGRMMGSAASGIADSFKTTDSVMFSNIGNKICGYAKVLCWIGIVVSVISGLGMAFSGCSQGGSVAVFTFIFGMMIACIGSLLSWVGSLVLYGFGDIARRVQAIEEYLRPGR